MQNKKILVVDNETRMVDSLNTLLTMEGYTVTSESDSKKALVLIDENDFDIVITDIKMPEIDGVEILKKAKEKDPFMGVIFITGYASLDSAKNAIDRGAYAYLTKPLEIDELKQIVARGIEKRSAELERLKLLNELKVTNEKLQLKLAQLNALTSSSNMLATTTTLKEALTSILSLAIDVIGAKIGSVMIINPDDNDLYIGASCGLEEDVIKNTRMKMGSSISGYVAETGKPLMIENIEEDPRFARINRQKYESKSLISVPLKYKGQISGVINLNNKINGQPFTLEDLSLLNSLAIPAAVAIDRASLISEKTQTINNLTILHNLSKKVSTLNDLEKIGEITFDSLSELLNIKTIFWYDYHERIHELQLEFYHGLIPENNIPENIRSIKTTEYPEIKGELDFEQIKDIIQTEFLGYYEDSFKIEIIPILLKRTLAGISVLIIPKESTLNTSQKDLAVLALSQTAAIYQRQKAILNATQLVTMGKLIAEIGHDLKRPLTNLKGSLQIYSEKIEGDLAKEFFPDAKKEVNRLSEFVMEMVEFSNPKKYQTRRLQIGTLLDKGLDLLKYDLTKKNINVIKNYNHNLPPVMVNDHEMLQVFINIFLNAVDSMDKGGSLKLTAAELEEDVQKWLRINIEDTGYGISKDKLNKIFEKYYTTKQGGSGLGLAIVERIISVHNGRMFVESKEGSGTTFTIDLAI